MIIKYIKRILFFICLLLAFNFFKLNYIDNKKNDVLPVVDTIKNIKTTKQINIGYRESSMPHSYVLNNEPVGYTIDICNKVVGALIKELDILDLKINYIPVTPANRIKLIQDGVIDMECGNTTNTQERKQFVNFTINTYASNARMVSKKEFNIKNIMDLNGKNVAITRETTSDRYLKEGEDYFKIKANIIYNDDNTASFNKLANNEVFAFITDDVVLAGLIADSSDPKLYEITGPNLSLDLFSIMVNKSTPDLKAIADKEILAMMKSGEMEKLYNKWFLSDIKLPNEKIINLKWSMTPEMKNVINNPSD